MTEARQGFLASRGIAAQGAKTPYWKPDSRKRYVLLLDVREPTTAERTKVIKLDNGEERILEFALIARVKENDQEKRWEIGSPRCVSALENLPGDMKLPGWISVQMVGKGKDTDYVIAPEAPSNNQKHLESSA